MRKRSNFIVIDECHYVSDFGFGFRNEFNRIWTNVLKSFFEYKKRPTSLMSASNEKESISDAIKILKINIDPNNSFWCPPKH